jgi:hypothetical protein
MVVIVTFDELSHGAYLDNYVWQLFHSKICVFLLLSLIHWSVNSMMGIWLIWLRTRVDEFSARTGLTLLLILILLGGSNFALLQLLIPFEIVRWLCITEKTWMPVCLQHLNMVLAWMPPDLTLVLTHISKSQFAITDNGILVIVPKLRILSLYPWILIPDTITDINSDDINNSDNNKCSCCNIDDNKQIYILSCKHVLCPKCYYIRLSKYGKDKTCVYSCP